MRQIPFGRTGLTVSELGFGTIPIIHLAPDEAHREVVPIPGFDTVEWVDQVVSFCDGPNVCTDDDLRRMDGYRTELGTRFCRRCEYCQPCPNGVMITMAIGYPVVAARMGPVVARRSCEAAMESVLQCTDCDVPAALSLRAAHPRHAEVALQRLSARLRPGLDAPEGVEPRSEGRRRKARRLASIGRCWSQIRYR